ncbi:unnamed protein product [Spirodela intermedia]|uniref:Uncharacterized protein n=1 Tax=Spirodela intermedia TaxID=51605 RepID=A0A7I8J9H3_SPIIN|nr:unnamed protein product [Spirodela intermedia]CAA6666868.1 unnamed protein product [Spirodela intermedia]
MSSGDFRGVLYGGAAVAVSSGDLRDNGRECGSDNMKRILSDGLVSENTPTKKNKSMVHRHTPEQIQQLEAFFKECPHPDENQRMELCRRLSLEGRQVKFWFQNRRTLMKTQLERKENELLRQENERLRIENRALHAAARSPVCWSCGGPAELKEPLWLENDRLREDLRRYSGTLAGRQPPHTAASSLETSMLVELALSAMDELVKKAQAEEPLWVRGGAGEEAALNEDEYRRAFPQSLRSRPARLVTAASKATEMVMITSSTLIDGLMDANRWPEIFPNVVARSSTAHVISAGIGGTRSGILQLMTAELQVLSPLVPLRELSFLRFCKELSHGVWAVVDVSVGTVGEDPSSPHSPLVYQWLPSGCVVEDMANGCSKVAREYYESAVHPLYRLLLRSGMALGAHRWVAALQRHCNSRAALSSSAVLSGGDSPGKSPLRFLAAGKREMLKLAGRMTENFCGGVSASPARGWRKLRAENLGEDVRVVIRRAMAVPGELSDAVICAAASVWLAAPPQHLLDLLMRGEWRILSDGGPVQEAATIATGRRRENTVSLLRAGPGCAANGTTLILREVSTDVSSSLVVHAPLEAAAADLVVNGGDSSGVALLPSGFVVTSDGSAAVGAPASKTGGSLLTVAFQILANGLSDTNTLAVDSVETVNSLISRTLGKIEAALHCCEC